MWERGIKKPNIKDKGTGDQGFTHSLVTNEDLVRSKFRKCGDVKYHPVKVAALKNRRAVIIYVEGLINEDILNRDIIAKLMNSPLAKDRTGILDIIAGSDVSVFKTLEDVEEKVLSGEIMLLVDGESKAYIISGRKWPMRSVEEPIQERAIKGPRDGFTETAKVNLGLIRRRIPNSTLKVETLPVGRRSSNMVTVLYMEDIADDDLVSEIIERIEAIDIDGIMESGVLSELITERTVSPFPLLLSTERPDKVTAGLLAGKVAIVVDGSPFCLLAPAVFADFYQVAEDYYIHPIYAFFARALRFAGLFISTTATAAYTAVIAFHYEIIPKNIIVFFAETREGVPFSPFVEAFAIEIVVELIREASIRLPGPIGPTIGIVGALVLGQAAVDARLVSPVLLIVVAVALMANFNIPHYEAALTMRFIRFGILAMAVFFGGYGIVIAWLVIGVHLCNLQSFGVPYMTPLAPFRSTEMGDFIYRKPWRWMRKRSGFTGSKNPIRQKGVESDKKR